ncbi:MAG: four helix bundle protein [Bacteroidota bacterium]
MEVWQTASNLSMNIFALTQALPRSEDYGLTSQIRRSANSIAANIAEGFGRKTSKDKANFYIMSRGSLYETQNHLIYGVKIGYFEKTKVDDIINNYNNLAFDLNKIIKSISQP